MHSFTHAAIALAILVATFGIAAATVIVMTTLDAQERGIMDRPY